MLFICKRFFRQSVNLLKFHFILIFIILGCSHSDVIARSERLEHSNRFLEDIKERKVQDTYNTNLKENNVRSLELLKNRKFKDLIKMNEKLQYEFKNNIKIEQAIDFELSSISNSRENLETILNDFIKVHPKHYVPYLYRGVYFEGKGWQSRGAKVAKNTTTEQFKWMQHYHNLAISDLNKSISLNNKILHSYIFNIKISAVNNNFDSFQKNLESAMSTRPESYGLWMTVAGFSAPRWGGSISKIQEVIDFSSQYYSKNPALKDLRFLVTIDQANTAYLNGDFKRAKKLSGEAIDNDFQASPRMRQFNPEIDLIDIYFREGKSGKACELVKAYIESNPVSWLAQTYAVWCKTYN